jgi:methyl-accepting chemotaxis protein
VLADDEQDMLAIEGERTESANSLLARLKQYAAEQGSGGEAQSGLLDAQRAVENYLSVWPRIEPLSRRSARDEAARIEARQLMNGEGFDAYSAAAKALEAVWQRVASESEQARREGESTYAGVLAMLLGLGAGALALGTGAAVLLTRSVVRPLAEAAGLAQAVAGGDLTREVVVTGRDETAQLLRSLAEMTGSLRAVVGQVRSASDSIATGSSQIASGNADLSQRTEEQASNLQQTAASMEQLASNVRNNTDSAVQAARMAGEAASVAERGGAVVGEVVGTMREIAEASSQIADIIGVIDGIAFQTNILALNAAVEAARAGEQGRGFAVVAGEVRTLAQRSADAAKQIKALINGSVEKVEAGTQQVDRARASMDEIVSQVQRVTQLMSEISAASQEQNSGIQRVGDAVQQLDQVTQQNAALVEESAAAAESLKAQAQRLADLVSTFRLAQGAAAPAPAAANARPPTAAHPNRANAGPKVESVRVIERLRQAAPAPLPAARAPATPPRSTRSETPSQAGQDASEWESF